MLMFDDSLIVFELRYYLLYVVITVVKQTIVGRLVHGSQHKSFGI
ncbi:hypothetical protein [Erwinia phage Pecta]|nr:hypothetical protein [Erwinia phage Pecta]